MKSLTKKNIVITGAANGIGMELALEFAREGANLFLLDIDKKSLAELEGKVTSTSSRTATYVCDMTKTKEIEKTAKAILLEYDHVDILINNAGYMYGRSVTEISLKELRNTIDLNLIGLIWMTKQFLPAMIERGQGHIVNVASAGGIVGTPKQAAYGTSKSAVVGFSDILRREMHEFGHRNIKVTCICPYYIKTRITKGVQVPFVMPFLKMEKVVKKITRAIKKERPFLFMPPLVSVAPFARVLPGQGDSLFRMLGITRSMNNHYEHKDE